MTFEVGAQVDGFVLTDHGWVDRMELDPSPYRPGDVVNGTMLTAALTWEPLREKATAPYVPGDLVEGYLLTPSGDWRPLADQTVTAPNAGGRRPTAAAVSTAPVTTAAHSTTRTTTTQRPAPITTTATPARAKQWRVGQVVNGHVLTADRGWVPVEVQPIGQRSVVSPPRYSQPGTRTRPTARPATTRPKKTSGSQAVWVVIGVILFSILRSCHG